jgi:hypothetical protein
MAIRTRSKKNGKHVEKIVDEKIHDTVGPSSSINPELSQTGATGGVGPVLKNVATVQFRSG